MEYFVHCGLFITVSSMIRIQYMSIMTEPSEGYANGT